MGGFEGKKLSGNDSMAAKKYGFLTGDGKKPDVTSAYSMLSSDASAAAEGGLFSSMGDFLSSPGVQYGLTGLTIGMQTGSGIANAMYNAEAMRMSARAVDSQSDLQAYLIREQYLQEYKALQRAQDRQQSQNRVDQAKFGIRGASANAVMQSYAAKSQKNLEVLYHNAAMSTGKQSLAAMAQKAALLEKARQYDWQTWQTAVAGVINFGGGMLNTWSRQNANTTNVDPTAPLVSGTPNDETVALANMFDGESNKKYVADMSYSIKKPSLDLEYSGKLEV